MAVFVFSSASSESLYGVIAVLYGGKGAACKQAVREFLILDDHFDGLVSCPGFLRPSSCPRRVLWVHD